MTKSQSIFFSAYLDELFPHAGPELEFKNHFELLVAVVLSAQTTDIAVNKVTKDLFKKYPNPARLSKALVSDIEKTIQSIGLYRTKAKNIVHLAKILMDQHGGQVPNNRKDLE